MSALGGATIDSALSDNSEKSGRGTYTEWKTLK